MEQSSIRLSRLTPLLVATFMVLLIMGCGSNPTSDFWKAVDAFRNKDYETAQSLADKVKAAQSDFIPAYILLGRIGTLKNDQQSASLNYRTAYDLMSRREFKLRTEDVQAQDSDIKISWQEAAFFLADAEFREMKYNRAEKYYDTIISDPASTPWKKTALAYKQSTHEFMGYRQKLDILRAQNRKTPNDPRIQADLSALLMDMASGLRLLGKEKSLKEQIEVAKNFRMQARQSLQAIYSASPETKFPQTEALLDYTESQANIMSGSTEVALQKALDACQKDPTNGKYHFTVTSILSVMAAVKKDPQYRMDERIEHAREAVKQDPKTWRYQTALAGLLKETGKMQEAAEQLMKARQVAVDKEIIKQIDSDLATLEREMGGKTAQPQALPPQAPQ